MATDPSQAVTVGVCLCRAIPHIHFMLSYFPVRGDYRAQLYAVNTDVELDADCDMLWQ